MTRNRQVRFCRRAGEGDFPRLVNGNGPASGQLYLGNMLRADGMRGVFDPEGRICRALPAPSVQAPELVEAPTAPLPFVVMVVVPRSDKLIKDAFPFPKEYTPCAIVPFVVIVPPATVTVLSAGLNEL